MIDGDLLRDNKKPDQELRDEASLQGYATGLLVGEWSRPLCSWLQVWRLMGPKAVASEDRIGFSPDDRNILKLYLLYNSN